MGIPISKPDQSISSGSIRGDLSAGKRVTVDLRLARSFSNADFSTGYYLSTDKRIGSKDDILITFKKGKNSNTSVTFTLPKKNLDLGRTYYLGAMVDYDKKIKERDEGNNTKVLGSFRHLRPQKKVVTSLFDQKKDFKLAGKNWSLIEPFSVDVEKSFHKGGSRGIGIGRVDGYVKGKVWADFEAGLDIGFNLGAVAGKSNLATDLEMFVPEKIEAGKQFIIDTSRWKYNPGNNAGFSLDDSNWGLTADLVLKGSAGIEVKAGAGFDPVDIPLLFTTIRTPRIGVDAGIKLQVNPNINFDLLGIGGIGLGGGWALSTSGKSISIEKGSKKFSLNAPQLGSEDSKAKGFTFTAERDADDNLLGANIDLVNLVTSMFPKLKPLNFEKNLINKKLGPVRAKAGVEGKLVSLDFNAGLGYGEEVTLDYDPKDIKLKLTFNGKTQKGTLGDAFTFKAPTNKSAKKLDVAFDYDGKIELDRGLNFNGGLTLGIGTFGAEFKIAGWGPEFSLGPLFETSIGLGTSNISIGKASQKLSFDDKAAIALAYA
uniref:CARDB protein n=1 Tax=Candidatus Kentrum sp. FW TaxID=2126338 RepID=A0A450U4A0_9GAMM|nr:MAG: hypothetical protein BECKFW1821C_GA0114237_11742 [Candidatus Kentron sp. FW]